MAGHAPLSPEEDTTELSDEALTRRLRIARGESVEEPVAADNWKLTDWLKEIDRLKVEGPGIPGMHIDPDYISRIRTPPHAIRVSPEDYQKLQAQIKEFKGKLPIEDGASWLGSAISVTVDPHCTEPTLEYRDPPYGYGLVGTTVDVRSPMRGLSYENVIIDDVLGDDMADANALALAASKPFKAKTVKYRMGYDPATARISIGDRVHEDFRIKLDEQRAKLGDLTFDRQYQGTWQETDE